MNSRWNNARKYFFGLFIIVVIASIYGYFHLKDQMTIEEFRMIIGGYGVWAPVVFIAIYIAATIFIPSTPFMALAGILFGFELGLFYTIIGGFLSSCLVFLVSRKLGKTWVDKILENKYLRIVGKYNARLERGGLIDLIILRIAPIMPFNVLNILMGISKISVYNYVLGTLLGLVPSNVAAVYFGSLLTKIF